MNLNKVLLMGNLTRPPQPKALPSGMQLCEMGLAVSRRYKTQSGEEREDVCFVDLTAFGQTADFCVRNLTKGSPVYVEGTLRMDSWTDRETGKNRTRLRVSVDTLYSLSRPVQPQQPMQDGFQAAQSPMPPQPAAPYAPSPYGAGSYAQQTEPAAYPAQRPMPPQMQSPAPEPPPAEEVADDLPF